MSMTAFRVVFQAGIGNSEPDHWQSIWARSFPEAVWVEQEDWDNPVRDAWVDRLLETLRGTPGRKVIVAHSLGCLAVSEAAAAINDASVAGAFLVSVPDVDGPQFPKSAVGFRPALSTLMPLKSIVVASSNDSYGSLDHAQRVARHWSCELVQVGAKGHINLKSGLGEWAEGRKLFEDFVASL